MPDYLAQMNQISALLDERVELQSQLHEAERKAAARAAEEDRRRRGGPRSPEGKRIASMNAVKSGLTGRTVLLPTDDADAYRGHLAAYHRELQPATLRESELVQSLADTQWRLARIPALESAIYTRGRYEAAEMYANHPEAERVALIQVEIHFRYEKQLRNLQLQESRLYRRYTQELAHLRRLQEKRKAVAEAAAKSAAKAHAAPATPSTGFVFATAPAQPQSVGLSRESNRSSSTEQTKKAA